jgi:1-acyl-sn-glycerol-3-phosphate acyltransferase
MGDVHPFPGKRAAPWTRLYARCAFALALAVFGAGGLFYSAVGPILHVVLPRRVGSALGQRVMTGLFGFFVALLHRLGLARCELAALDALRDGPPMIIAPNHPTYLDAMLILSRLPNVVCIMKADVLDNVFLGGGAKLAGYIPAHAPREMIRAAAAALAAGRHVLFFPEGTRTVRAPVNAFRGGFAAIARRAQVPVQAVVIEAYTAYMRKGWPLLRMPEFPLVYRVRLGERFAPPTDSRTLVAALEASFRRELGAAPK